MSKPYIIAEIGVNHNGEIAIAKECITAAVKAGADAVKFQYFNADSLAAPDTPKADYQNRSVATHLSHRDMLKQLELNFKQISEIYFFCKNASIDFICTPYGVNEASELKKMGMTKFKTASLDLTDYFLHDWLANNAKEVIIATGAANYDDILECLKLYEGCSTKITLLHCVSNYPCSDDALNLLNIVELSKRFGHEVGFSDHSLDSTAAQISCALGIKTIERHFTLSKMMIGPDHQASDTPEMFSRYVNDVQRAVNMLGTYKKSLREEEKSISVASRKSLVWAKNLSVGSLTSKSDFTARRPGIGIKPMKVHDLIGKQIQKNVFSGEIVKVTDVE